MIIHQTMSLFNSRFESFCHFVKIGNRFKCHFVNIFNSPEHCFHRKAYNHSCDTRNSLRTLIPSLRGHTPRLHRRDHRPQSKEAHNCKSSAKRRQTTTYPQWGQSPLPPNSTEGIRLDRRIILQCGQRAFSIDIAHLLNDLPGNLRTACEIDVTGICIPEYDADITCTSATITNS